MNKLRLFLTVASFASILTANTQVTIITTDFQSGIPVDYTIIDNDGFTPDASVSDYTSAWISTQDPENNSNLVAGSTSYFDPVGVASRWLITPALALGPYGNFISWSAKSHDASFPDDYLVLVSTTDTDPTSFIDTIGYVIEEYADWTSRTIDISDEGYNDQTIYIAFVNVTNNGFKLYMDDIQVWKEDPASTNEISQEIQIKVYPNPFIDQVKVTSESPVLKMTLFDLSGNNVLESNVNDLNTISVSAGAYFLKVETEKGTKTVKLIKN